MIMNIMKMIILVKRKKIMTIKIKSQIKPKKNKMNELIIY